MRISREKFIPALSAKIQSILTGFSNSRTASAFLVKRSKIILLAAQATSNKDIALKLGIHHNTVSLWRRRFIDSESVLAFVEAELPDDLKELLTTILSDEYRSGAPRTYSSNVRSRIKIVACQNPEDYGFTISHWNLPCLRLALIDAGIVDDISYGAIYNILKTDEIRPWKIRYWLHSKEKYEDYETYKAKIQAINQIYADAVALGGKEDNSNIRTFCTDEMTGIQALEHLFPDKPTAPGMDAKREFDYVRHGTTSLIGFYNVTNGKMAEPYLNPTRTEEDFVAALKALIDTGPDKSYRIVCDNLNTHMSETLVRYVAEQIGYEEPLGKKGESGILQTKATRAAFLSNPEHRICFYYAPIHCSWMNQIEIWFGILNRQLLRRKSFVSVESLEQCIRAYIVQYNKYFAHPFKWTYASVPEIQREDAV